MANLGIVIGSDIRESLKKNAATDSCHRIFLGSKLYQIGSSGSGTVSMATCPRLIRKYMQYNISDSLV